MNNFDLRKYLAEGKLISEGKKVTADIWAKLSDDGKMDALLSVFKDPDDAEKHWEKDWNDLPDEKNFMMIYEVYSEKQRRWACSQDGPTFDEMCKDTAISKKKKVKEIDDNFDGYEDEQSEEVDATEVEVLDDVEELEIEKEQEVTININLEEDKDWIQKAIKRPGALHRALDIPQDEDIPKSLINKDIKKMDKKEDEEGKLDPKDLRFLRQLDLAKTLEKFNEGDEEAMGSIMFDAPDRYEVDGTSVGDGKYEDDEMRAQNIEGQIEGAILDSMGGDGEVDVSFEEFDINDNPLYTVYVNGESNGIVTVNSKGDIYDYNDDYTLGYNPGNFPYGSLNEGWINSDLEKRQQTLYDELVPGMGNADTLEGEMLRAINRIIYRYYNDGDFFYKGYGTETAGPAHSFLINSSEIPLAIQSTLQSIFTKIMQSSGDEEQTYERAIEFALKQIVDYIEAKNGNYTPSDEDMFKYPSEYEDEEDYEDDYDDYYDDEEDDY
jgi:hypothetical protein